MRTERILCRVAEANDFKVVSRQLADSYRAAYRGLMREEYLSALPDDHCVSILEASQAAGHTCLLAERGAEPVGSIVFGWSTADPRPGVAEIFALYLLPDWAGKGIGHRLYRMAERRMLTQGAVACVAEALCENLRSIHFCLKHGFYEAGAFTVEENGMLLHCKTLRKEWKCPEIIYKEGIETR